MAKITDPVKVAKLLSKATGIPLPKVANVMQKYPLDTKNIAKIKKELNVLAAQQLDATFKTLGF